MTQGGPGFSTDVITSTIYKEYQAGFYGLSTAGNVVLFVIVMLLVYPMMRFFQSVRSSYEFRAFGAPRTGSTSSPSRLLQLSSSSRSSSSS